MNSSDESKFGVYAQLLWSSTNNFLCVEFLEY